MSITTAVLNRISNEESALNAEMTRNNTDPLALLRREFPEIESLAAGNRVLDFGCGHGVQIRALSSMASRAVGVENNPTILAAARTENPATEIVERVTPDMYGMFDLVISQNSFEHFENPEKILGEMVKLLCPTGKLLITFGPPWKAPYGSHMHFFCRLPWLNLLFSESAVMSCRSRFRDDGACRYEDVPGGLNRMTVERFENLLESHNVEMIRHRCVFGIDGLSQTWFREYLTNRLSAVILSPHAEKVQTRILPLHDHVPGISEKSLE